MCVFYLFCPTVVGYRIGRRKGKISRILRLSERRAMPLLAIPSSSSIDEVNNAKVLNKIRLLFQNMEFLEVAL